MRHYKIWCLNNDVSLQQAMLDAMDHLTGWRQDAMTPKRHDAKAPQGSGGCSDLSSEPDQTTTTTTTVAPRRHDARPPEPTLPLGPVGVVQSGSRHSLDDCLAYAQAVNEKDGSIKWPVMWANKNIETGKFDVMIDQWKRDKDRPPLPDLRPCRKCGTYFRPKDEKASGVYCNPGCNY